MKSKPREKATKTTNHQTQCHWHEMNRKQRREMTRLIQSEEVSLEVVHPDAAGIDIGNEFHYVAVPPSRDNQPVQRFGCTTGELRTMANWLKQCRVRREGNDSLKALGQCTRTRKSGIGPARQRCTCQHQGGDWG